MASLKQRGGKYYAQFYDKDGKQCRVSTGIDVTPKDGSKPAINRRRAQHAADIIERRAKGETSGKAGDDAQRYQERQVAAALEMAKQREH